MLREYTRVEIRTIKGRLPSKDFVTWQHCNYIASCLGGRIPVGAGLVGPYVHKVVFVVPRTVVTMRDPAGCPVGDNVQTFTLVLVEGHILVE